MKGYNLFILLAVIFVSDYAFSQTCPCSTVELSDGLTGNDVIELLCPGGELGENTRFDLVSDLVVIGDEFSNSSFLVDNFEDGSGHCLVIQGKADAEFNLTSQEVRSCKASVINGCGLNSHPIPTLSEWGLIAMAGILGMIGLFAVMRRRKVTA